VEKLWLFPSPRSCLRRVWKEKMDQTLGFCDLVIAATQCLSIAPLFIVSVFIRGWIDCVTALRASKWAYLASIVSLILSVLFRPLLLVLAVPSAFLCYELTSFLCDAADCGVSFETHTPTHGDSASSVKYRSVMGGAEPTWTPVL
jgi:hypothetical protein